MGRITLSYNPKTGDPQVIENVTADILTAYGAINGNLDSTNVRSAAAATLDGQANTQGDGLFLALANHTHLIQGVEQLAAQPSTGNFPGRVYWDTVMLQLRVCSSLAGPTFVPLNSLVAADLPDHAAQHATGGGDAIPNGGIGADMLGRNLELELALSGDQNITNGAHGTVTFGSAIAFTVAAGTSQLVQIKGAIQMNNGAGTATNLHARIMEGAVVLKKLPQMQVPASTGANVQTYHFDWSHVFAAGAHTLLFKMGASQNSLQAIKQDTFDSETADSSFLQVIRG